MIYHHLRAPLLSPCSQGPFTKWTESDYGSDGWSVEGLERGIKHLKAHVAKHGPYDGIYGFSAGAAVATIASSRVKKENRQWRFVLTACGAFAPGMERVTAVAALHLIGGHDPIRADSEKLSALYERQKTHCIAYAAHAIPLEAVGDAHLRATITSFLALYRPTGGPMNLQARLASAPLVVFIKPGCGMCSQALDALKEAHLEPVVVNLLEDPTGVLKAELIALTEVASVPQCFANGQFIGGCNDKGLGGVVPCLANGKLQEILK